MPGRSYLMRIGTRYVPARVTTLKHKVDVNNLEHIAARTLALNEIGLCNIATATPVAFDPYAENRETGAFILIDRYTNATAGAGMISFGLRRATNIHRQSLLIDKSRAHAPARPSAGDPVVHRPARFGQEHDRQHRRARTARRAAFTPICWMATTCATA